MTKYKFKAWLELRSNAYGFGKDYTLHVSSGFKTRSFWLGQDAKVFSRVLGMDMRDAVPHYSELAKSKEWGAVMPLIAKDLVLTITNKDFENGIRELLKPKIENWELHVGGG